MPGRRKKSGQRSFDLLRRGRRPKAAGHRRRSAASPAFIRRAKMRRAGDAEARAVTGGEVPWHAPVPVPVPNEVQVLQ